MSRPRLFVRTLALSLIFSSMVSCAFREDSSEIKKAEGREEAERSFVANKGFSEGEITHEFIPGEKPNEYSVRISWPKGRPLLVKLERDGQLLSLHRAETENQTVVPCVDGLVRASVIVISATYGQVSRQSLEIICPIDLVVNRSVVLDDITTNIGGRLYLANGARLQVVRKDLALELIGVVVDGAAEIQVFSESRSTDWRRADRETAPPEIKIKAKWARGHLTFKLNGVDGVPGLDRETSRNTPGVKGADGETDLRCRPSRFDPDSGCQTVCLRPPGDGGPGADGVVAGQRGGDGGSGLGTSRLRLDIDDVSQFSADVELNPGSGGRAGRGSSGQAGGEGGPPGSDKGGVCPAAKPGASGAKHPVDGEDGSPGANGSCGPILVSPGLVRKIGLRDLNLSCSKMPGLVSPL